jgi:hypothetical protein
MDDYESLSHTKWECKYHVVFIPKYRRKVLYGELKQYLGDVFRKLALQKESKIEQGRSRSHRNIRFHRWSALSRERARYTWPVRMERGNAISWDSISGQEGTSSRP